MVVKHVSSLPSSFLPFFLPSPSILLKIGSYYLAVAGLELAMYVHQTGLEFLCLPSGIKDMPPTCSVLHI